MTNTLFFLLSSLPAYPQDIMPGLEQRGINKADLALHFMELIV